MKRKKKLNKIFKKGTILTFTILLFIAFLPPMSCAEIDSIGVTALVRYLDIGLYKIDCASALDSPQWTVGGVTPAPESFVAVMPDADGICIDNTDSNIAVDLFVRATTTGWELGDTAGIDICVWMLLFSVDSSPGFVAGDFNTANDLVTSSYVEATTSGGNGKYEGTGSGQNLADNAQVYAYCYFKAPSTNTFVGISQTVTTTIKAETH